jgi:hypothetical protein
MNVMLTCAFRVIRSHNHKSATFVGPTFNSDRHESRCLDLKRLIESRGNITYDRVHLALMLDCTANTSSGSTVLY